jgi:hypothetical protein
MWVQRRARRASLVEWAAAVALTAVREAGGKWKMWDVMGGSW